MNDLNLHNLKDRNCSICIDEMKDPIGHELDSKTEKLFHVFCRSCLTDWFLQKNTFPEGECPLCQKNITILPTEEEKKEFRKNNMKKIGSILFTTIFVGMVSGLLESKKAASDLTDSDCSALNVQVKAIEKTIENTQSDIENIKDRLHFWNKGVEVLLGGPYLDPQIASLKEKYAKRLAEKSEELSKKARKLEVLKMHLPPRCKNLYRYK